MVPAPSLTAVREPSLSNILSGKLTAVQAKAEITVGYRGLFSPPYHLGVSMEVHKIRLGAF